MKYKVYKIDDFVELNYYEQKNIKIINFTIYLILVFIIFLLLFCFLGKIDYVIKAEGTLKTIVTPVYITTEEISKISSSLIVQNKFVKKDELLYSIENSQLLLQKNNLEEKISELDDTLKYFLSGIINKENNNILEEEFLKEQHLLQLKDLDIKIKEAKKEVKTLNRLLKIGGVSEKEYNQAVNTLNILTNEKSSLVFGFKKHRHQKIFEIKEGLNIFNLEFQKTLLKLDKTYIRSPIDGFTEIIKPISPGEIILDGVTVATIIPDSKDYNIHILVKEKHILKIKENMSIKYNLLEEDKIKKTNLYGSVLKISNEPVTLNNEKYYLIIGSIENNKSIFLRKGITLKSHIIIGEKRILIFLLEFLNLKNSSY